ncbi:hypothetical protein TKK_0004051 [Trichogramma kaykai]|uniref:Uncharacterized protein n=1 Tax=Trichogramma kaykai TaxID=54128 RepID=A0ABD2XPK7_9HYME
MDIHKLSLTEHNIECPFTWISDQKYQKNVKDFCEKEFLLTDCEESPITYFIQMNTLAYIRCKQNKFDAAEELINEIDDVWIKICERVSEQNNYSVDVLIHIKNATALCIYKMNGEKNQAKALEIKIKDAKHFNSNIEKGTIFGSKAIALCVFVDKSNDTALQSAKLAIKNSPNCALWHYITAYCLRTERRQKNSCSIVSEQEKQEFLKCYELSPSDHYKICIARMYKECKSKDLKKKSKEMYNNMYEDMLKNPKNSKFTSILALHFIGQRDRIKAKTCLDNVENSDKTYKAYHHYLGKYYETFHNYLKAKENYLAATGEMGNFHADSDYLYLIRKISKSKDDDDEVIKHLEKMLERYEDDKSRRLFILLNLAIMYLFKNKNLMLAAENFLKALEIEVIEIKHFENFRMSFKDKEKYNIFDLISKNILTAVNQNNNENILKKLKNYCIGYNKKIERSNDANSLKIKFTEELLLEK